MTLAQEITHLAQTAKHNRAALADVDWRPLLLQVEARLDLLEQVKYAKEVRIVRDDMMPDYARVEIEMTLGPDTLATMLEMMAE